MRVPIGWRLRAALAAVLVLASNAAPAESTLSPAIRQGDLAAVRRMVEAGADVNDASGGFSPLLVALHRGREEIAHFLLARGADAISPGPYGVSALHLARSAAMARELIDHGADVDAWAKSYATPLHAALQREALDVARVLIAGGAALDVPDINGSTALHYAAGKGEDALVGALLDAGAEIAATNRAGFTALHWAAANDHGSTADLLLARGAPRGARAANGLTAAGLALSKGHAALARHLAPPT